jgi:hypothetical protein
MKKMRVFPWLLAFVLIFGFYGTAFSGGGPEDPACPAGTDEDPLPEPTAGPYLYGTFTVARVVGLLGDFDTTYSVQITLRRKWKTHLFSFQSPLGEGNLCELDERELMEIFKRLPCQLGVGDAFGLEGIPVIKKLWITVVESELCGGPGEMIRGWIWIRVVPDE